MNYEMLREILAVRRRSFLFLLFLALLNVALFLFLGFYQRPALEKAQKEWFAKREALASGQTVGAATLYQNGVRDLALFQQRIVAKKDFPRLLNDIFDAAKKGGLSVTAVTYTPLVLKEQKLVSYGIVFGVSGKYPAIKAFIGDLAGFKEILTVESVTLSNASPTEEAVALRVSLTAYLKTEGA